MLPLTHPNPHNYTPKHVPVRKGFSLTKAKLTYCLLKQNPRGSRAVLEFYSGVVLSDQQELTVRRPEFLWSM